MNDAEYLMKNYGDRSRVLPVEAVGTLLQLTPDSVFKYGSVTR